MCPKFEDKKLSDKFSARNGDSKNRNLANGTLPVWKLNWLAGSPSTAAIAASSPTK
jgi:hypothetical protein